MDRKKYWDKLKKFETIDDVPDLPVVSEKDWKEYYVPILIKCGAIPKNDLIVGKDYIGNCRNSGIAKWNGEQFEYNRTKWGFSYKDKINHFEDDNGFDLFVPIKLIE